jgi:hypothetical protein
MTRRRRELLGQYRVLVEIYELSIRLGYKSRGMYVYAAVDGLGLLISHGTNIFVGEGG